MIEELRDKPTKFAVAGHRDLHVPALHNLLVEQMQLRVEYEVLSKLYADPVKS